jgi:hypothetical protein
MLQQLPIKGTAPPVKLLAGTALKRIKATANATMRAAVAHELYVGEAQVVCPTRRQCCAITGSSIGYLGAFARATSEERSALAMGKGTLHALSRRKPVKPPIEGEILELIAKVGLKAVIEVAGPAAVLTVIDAITSPVVVAA